MRKYTIVNWSTKEEIEITAINCIIENYQFVFLKNEDGKIWECCFSTRMWDIREVIYDC